MSEPYVPQNPCVRGILKLFLDEKNADVVFDVNDGHGEEKFHAHRSILQGCAPELYEYCEGCEEDSNSIPIKGVKTQIFRHLLYYV